MQPAVHKSMLLSCIPAFTGDQPGQDFDKSRLSLTAEHQPPAPTRHHVFYFLPKTTQRGMIILLSQKSAYNLYRPGWFHFQSGYHDQKFTSTNPESRF